MRSVLAAQFLLAPAAVHAQAEPSLAERVTSRAADAVAVMRGQVPATDVFNAQFLAAVSESQIRALADGMVAENGPITGMDEVKSLGPGSASFVIRFAKAKANAVIHVDQAAPYKVSGLRIMGVVPTDDAPQKILADFDALPGSAGFAVVRLGDKGLEPILSARGNRQYAVGSAFKLWVLDALAQDIAEGRHRWDEVVRLDGLRSWPSGQTQNWPQGASVTVETLATLMISISDNTATDALVQLVGRERLAASVRASGHSQPDRMLPFLTTLEAFTLKDLPQDAERYARADEAGQARQLAELQARLKSPQTGGLPGLSGSEKPRMIDSIEWFASPEDVARVFDRLRKRSGTRVREILAVAPAMAGQQRSEFAYVGYKGGSEPGVIALNWLVRGKSGAWYVVAASWNDPQASVDNVRFERLAQRLIALLR
ncbi:MAG: serine hydrolase [Novosphingobium sp.]